MRVGLVDVGSQAVQLCVLSVDAACRPEPARSWKLRLPLGDALGRSGFIDSSWIRQISRGVEHAAALAKGLELDKFLPFATAVVRDAPNRNLVVATVHRRTGIRLRCFAPEQEARLSYLAARHWFGLSAGPLTLLDIGGGTVEAAAGTDEYPAAAVSLPMGAGRVTREWLPGDPPTSDRIAAARAALARAFDETGDQLAAFQGARAVGTSTMLRQLARYSAAAGAAATGTTRRTDILVRDDLHPVIERLAGLTTENRALLPGISRARAKQALAGALICDAAMERFGITQLEMCPWGLREGIALSLSQPPDTIRPIALATAPTPGPR